MENPAKISSVVFVVIMIMEIRGKREIAHTKTTIKVIRKCHLLFILPYLLPIQRTDIDH